MVTPSPYHPAVGIAGLKVYLSSAPQPRAFDAACLRLPVIRQEELVELEVEPSNIPLIEGNQLRMAAGRFALYDHEGHTQYGFSLGGELELGSQDGLTVCSLHSTAPIFLLQENPEAPDVLLADELDTLVARRRAVWGEKEEGFARQMAAAEPMHLLAACLAKIEARLKRILAHSHDDQYVSIVHFIDHIRLTLQEAGKWPEVAPEIEELL